MNVTQERTSSYASTKGAKRASSGKGAKTSGRKQSAIDKAREIFCKNASTPGGRMVVNAGFAWDYRLEERRT